MDSKRKLWLLILCLFMVMLLSLTSISGLAAGEHQSLVAEDFDFVNRPNGGGGNIGGYSLYDSGWYALRSRPDDIAVQFDHNLGGDPDIYLIKLECRDDIELKTYDCVNQAFTVDAHWYGLTNSAISVYVRGGTRPDHIRVRIFIELPVYDSSWDQLGARPDPIAVLFTHNLSGDADQYLVDLICDDDSLGVYDCAAQNFTLDANWFGLTSTGIYVWAKNYRPDAVRVRIFVKPNAGYDSGWDEIGARPDPLPLHYQHNLGGNPDIYYVDLECRDDTSLQTYQCGDQGFSVNAHWYALTDSSISVFVIGASLPDYVRVRIWTTHSLFLPLVVRE